MGGMTCTVSLLIAVWDAASVIRCYKRTCARSCEQRVNPDLCIATPRAHKTTKFSLTVSLIHFDSCYQVVRCMLSDTAHHHQQRAALLSFIALPASGHEPRRLKCAR